MDAPGCGRRGSGNYKRPQSSALDLLSVPQAGKILGISECTLRNRIQRKKIARVKVGGRVMFRPDTIREFIAYNTRPASG